jgi:peptide/nickel transport system permease protein
VISWEQLSKRARFGVGILAVFVLIATIGPWLVGDATELVGVPLQPPSWQHWLGTTGQGQDVLAQTVVGARSSLVIGFGVGITVVFIGALIGTTAGYFGGWVDDVLVMFINVFLVMPGLPLIVVLAAHLPPTPMTVAFVLVVTGWAWGARVFRSQAMSLRDRDFVTASKVGGESAVRIIAIEILPNMLPLLASAFIGATVYAIGAQIGLEFLGLGDIERVTWGTNLYWAQNDSALLTGSWWTFVPTGASVALVGFALALVNGAIDEIGNPRLRAEDRYLRETAQARLRIGGATPVLRRSPSSAAPKPVDSTKEPR